MTRSNWPIFEPAPLISKFTPKEVRQKNTKYAKQSQFFWAMVGNDRMKKRGRTELEGVKRLFYT